MDPGGGSGADGEGAGSVMEGLDTDLNAGKGKSIDEGDTCRICRAEGTEEEPLFYPCKCSGSIKFVHQACLMEWLSHSQKKYCELCKTPFRFTKLYHPHMPRQLPFLIFLRQLVLHGLRGIVTWLRCILVILVWLGMLPFSMRAVWRLLFWIADGGWVNVNELEQRAMEQRLATSAGNGTSSARDTLNPIAEVNGLSHSISNVSMRVVEAFGLSTGGRLYLALGKKLFADLVTEPHNPSMIIADLPQQNDSIGEVYAPMRSSWFSEVSFLRTLTRFPTLNNIMVDTLEGACITISVVITFILIFLIREWVVQQQQQPGAPNPGAVEGEELAEANAENGAPAQALNAQEAQADNAARAAGMAEGVAQGPDNGRNDGPRHIAIPRFRRRGLGPNRDEFPPLDVENRPGHDGESDYQAPQRTASNQSPIGTTEDTLPSGLSPARPALPARHALDDAAIVQRTIDEGRGMAGSQQWPGLDVFKDLWNRAGGNPSEVLKIIDEEDRREELGWIVSQMERRRKLDQNSTRRRRASTFDWMDSEYEDRTTSNPEIASPSYASGFERAEHQYSPIVEPPYQAFMSLSSDRQELSAASNISRTGAGAAVGLITNEDPPVRSDSTPESWDMVEEQLSVHHGNSSPVAEAASTSPGEGSAHASLNVEGVAANNVSGISPILEIPASTDDARIPEAEAVPLPATDVYRSFRERIIEMCWGGVREIGPAEPVEPNDEQVVQDIAQEAPFVPVVRDQRDGEGNQDNGPNVQPPNLGGVEVLEGLQPNDAEAVEDAEDLEGILELIGMQGPIFGLVQNAVFSAVLISITLAIGIWMPYIWGKIALLFLTKPFRFFVGAPLWFLSFFANTLVDALLLSFGMLVYAGIWMLTICTGFLAQWIPMLAARPDTDTVASATLTMARMSGRRLERVITGSFLTLSAHPGTDFPLLSIISRQALHVFKSQLAHFAELVVHFPKSIVHNGYLELILHPSIPDRRAFIAQALSLWQAGIQGCQDYFKFLVWFTKDPSSDLGERHTLQEAEAAGLVDYDFIHWSTQDRVLAIVLGYLFVSLLGYLYLKVNKMIIGAEADRKVQGIVADILHQAGGVMKVILIIGIEMIVFPLYCGLLLDFALMPLFENVTVASRIAFTTEAPLTSLFVHWFVGTCYMFHFALFVSMCRKIMRPGVLYFIRDPDDPTFHPVRDVLERNITTQLSKIAFSALVYGALVVVCLGGVVWTLAATFQGVLPVHWSSNEPVLEFPVDLLFYNFLMPLLIRSVQPSEKMNAMYDWWFHKCARLLRLSNFLFGDKQEDEEIPPVHANWQQLFSRRQNDLTAVSSNDDTSLLQEGKFVRTPASDQVRIPKGGRVFVEVDKDNNRIDQDADRDDGLHGRNNEMFTKVYIPPKFRSRVGLLIIFIWLFAAITGIAVTIGPLVIGRRIVSYLTHNDTHVNDMYAFSIGLYASGAIAYTVLHYQSAISTIWARLQPYLGTPAQLIPKIRSAVTYVLRLTYLAFSFGVLLPSLFALITELYLHIPLQTILGSADHHVIYFVQDWTLGVLYVRIALKAMTWNQESRPAAAVNAIVQRGWLDPDAWLATRAFIFPASVVATTAILVPPSLGGLLYWTLLRDNTVEMNTKVFRFCYPASLGLILALWCLHFARHQVNSWRLKIRDDVYLIGERLHNFGEKKKREIRSPRRVSSL